MAQELLSPSGLMRSIGLDVDGPARWGARPATRAPGVFAVEVEHPTRSAPFDIVELRHWLEHVPTLRIDGQRPTESALAERLGTFWVPGQTLVYVGRSAKGLGSRVAALYATRLGDRRPHSGGHWLKTLREQHKFKLWWAETDAPEEYEDALLAAFAAAVPEDVRDRLAAQGTLLPWANLDTPAGVQRETGLSGSLNDNDSSAPASSIKRSDAPGRSAKRSPSATGAVPKSPRRVPVKAPSNSPKREAATPVTAAGLEALKAELNELKTVQRPQVVERVKHARELGDLRENADYEAARNEQSFLEGRILALEQQLRTAVVIKGSVGSSIAMGSTVRYEVDGADGEMTIVGSTESDPAEGRISAASPVGKALLGHRVGDDVVVRTPAAEMHYRILEIR